MAYSPFILHCNWGGTDLERGYGYVPRSLPPLFSPAYQFTINVPLICPPFSTFRKICIFNFVFGQNFSSQEAKFPNFRSQDPSFFKENPLPRPYFWKSARYMRCTHQKIVECPRACEGAAGGSYSHTKVYTRAPWSQQS